MNSRLTRVHSRLTKVSSIVATKRSAILIVKIANHPLSQCLPRSVRFLYLGANVSVRMKIRRCMQCKYRNSSSFNTTQSFKIGFLRGSPFKGSPFWWSILVVHRGSPWTGGQSFVHHLQGWGWGGGFEVMKSEN